MRNKTCIILFIIILGLQLVGTFVTENSGQDSEPVRDVNLWIQDAEETHAQKGLNLTIYDFDSNPVTSKLSNNTGHVALKLKDGSYSVLVQTGNRTVGHQDINITKSELLTIKTWAYNLNVTCTDLENNPLPDHIVLLYDQLRFYSPTNITAVANQTDVLANWTKTDEQGTAVFYDLWNGTYLLRVVASEIIGEQILDLQQPENIVVTCRKTYMKLRILTSSNEPIEKALVNIQNSIGRLIFRDQADRDGYILHQGMYLDNYTVSVDWTGTQVWSGVINLQKNRETTIRCSVYKLTLRFFDQFDNSLPGAEVNLRMMIAPGRYVGQIIKLSTDNMGTISSFLPSATYEVSCTYGIYTGLSTVSLVSDYVGTVKSNVNNNLWTLSFLVTSPLIVLTVFMERRRLRKPLEIRKYRNMLSKLESMYSSGLVEYKVYRKLRTEYEDNLMELGGRSTG